MIFKFFKATLLLSASFILFTGCGGGSDTQYQPIINIDTTPPVLTLNGEINVKLNEGDAYTELGATATDDIDGAVNVTSEGFVDTTTIGVYSITYTAKDKAGNEASLTRQVTVDKYYKIMIENIDRNTAFYGLSAQFSITLSHKPTHPVMVHVESSDKSEGIVVRPAGDPQSWTKDIIIEPENWDYGKVVVIRGTNKNVINGKQDYKIITSPAVSDDQNFNGIDPEDVVMKGEYLEFIAPSQTIVSFVGVAKKIDLDYKHNGSSAPIYVLEGEPEGMILDGNQLIWTPSEEDEGKSYTIKVRLQTDPGYLIELSDEGSFELRVAKKTQYDTTLTDKTLTIVDNNTLFHQASIKILDKNLTVDGLKIVHIDTLSETLFVENYKNRISDIFMLNKDNNGPILLRIPVKNIPQDIDPNSIRLLMYENTDHLAVEMELEYTVPNAMWIDVHAGEGLIREYLGEEVLEFVFYGNRPLMLLGENKDDSNRKEISSSESLSTKNVIQSTGDVTCTPRNNNLNYLDCVSKSDTKLKLLIKMFKDRASSSAGWRTTSAEDLASWIVEARKFVPSLGLDKFDDHLTIYIDKHIINDPDLKKRKRLGFVSRGKHPNEYDIEIYENREIIHLSTVIEGKVMIKGTVVHEFFHHTQARNSIKLYGKVKWFIEGTARWFEDEIYDKLNLYRLKERRGYQILAVGLASEVNKKDKRTRPYNKFAYFKLMSNKCTKFRPNYNQILSISESINYDKGGIKQFRTKLTDLSCNFSMDLGNTASDILASSFVYYNWATLGQTNGPGNMLLLDAVDEGRLSLTFVQLGDAEEFRKENWYTYDKHQRHLDLDLHPKYTYDAVIPAYGAKSFKIFASALPQRKSLKEYSTDTITLSLDTLNDNPNIKLVATKANLEPTTTNSIIVASGEKRVLTNEERNNDYFVTLVNPSGVSITIGSMRLIHELIPKEEDEEEDNSTTPPGQCLVAGVRTSSAVPCDTDETCINGQLSDGRSCKSCEDGVNSYGEPCDDNSTESPCDTDESRPVYSEDGVIEVTLSWSCASQINMDLDFRGDNVIQDVKDVPNYGLEHAYVASLYDINPSSVYSASATGGKREQSDLNESYLEDNPINIYAVVKTPEGSKFKQYEARNFGQLNLGQFISVNLNGKEIDATIHDYSGGGGGDENSPTPVNNPTEVRPYDECDDVDKKYTCGCVPCEYILHGMIGAVEYGPIGGADVEVIRADTYGSVNQIVEYRGKTTNDSDLFKSGLVKFSQDDYAKFEDDVYYVVDAKGGADLDRDDNLVKDVVPTKNNGTIHAIIKGSDLKTVAFRVNALTEAIYQTSGELLGNGYNEDRLQFKLDLAAKKLFREKTFIFNNELEINYHDVLLWTPGVDKKKLFKLYDTFVEPIVVKTYADEDRAKESYRLIYEKLDTDAPQLTPLAVEISHTVPNGSIIGKVSIEKEGISGIDHIALHGDANSTFSINKEGLVKVVDASALILNAVYKLDMIAVNEDNKSSISMELIVKVIEGAPLADSSATVPTLESIVLHDVLENSPAGTLVGQANFVDSSLNIVSYHLRGEDNSSFTVDSNGQITVTDGADIDFEKSDVYHIKISAINEVGNESFPIALAIHIVNDIDTPLHDLIYFVHLSENVPIGTVVGKVEQLREGKSPISSFDILNSNVPFKLDVNGTIRTTGYINYEDVDAYSLLAIAKTDSGNGNKVEIQILIDNVDPEMGTPSIEAFSVTIDENTNVGTEVGVLNIIQGGSSVGLVELRGIGSSNFTVDINGTITVASTANLNYEAKRTYTLEAIAHNANGSSVLVPVNIALKNLEDNAPTLLPLTQSIREDAVSHMIIGTLKLESYGEGNIIDYTLTGRGNENFTIDNSGTIRVSSSSNLDYERESSYTLSATVLSDVGESEPVQVRIYIRNIAEHIPVLKSFIGSVKENVIIGTIVGRVKEGIGGDSLIVSYELNDDANFKIDTNGIIRVNTPLDYEDKKTYNLSVTATNIVGTSNPVTVTIYISNIIDEGAVLNDAEFTVSEDSSVGTFIGKMDVNTTGNSTITRMLITGIGAEKFSIDKNGTISLGEMLDYETKQLYTLNVTATNSFGESNMAKLTLVIENVLESSPIVHDVNLTLKSNTSVDSLVANILKELVDTPIDEFIVTGTNMFAISTNGDIYLQKPLYAENQTSYTFSAYAKTSTSSSNISRINIEVVSSIIKTIDTPSRAMGVTISSDGTKAYVADGNSGLQIIDLSSIMEAYIIGAVDTPYYAMSVVLSSDETKAFVADGNSGIQIIDISVPSSPQIIGSIYTFGFANDLKLSLDESKIYVADGYAGIQIIDIATAKIIQTIVTDDYAKKVTLSKDGNKMYITEGNNLQIVDISSDTTANIIETTYTPNYNYNVLLSSDRNYAYHASGSVGLDIVDISDITATQSIEMIDTSGWAQSVALSKDERTIFVADDRGGIQIIDIRKKELEDKVPGLYSEVISIEEDTSIGATVGQMQIIYSGASGITSILIEGDGAEDFTIDVNATLRLKNALNHTVKSEYDLTVLATNSVGTREVYIKIKVHTVPEILDLTTTIKSMISEDTLIAKLSMGVDNNTTISSILLSGDGSEDFIINTTGEIYVAPNVNIHHFIKSEYNLTVLAENTYGSSDVANVNITVSPIVSALKSFEKIEGAQFSRDDSKIYMVSDDLGFQVIDISNLHVPTILSRIPLPDYIESMTQSYDSTKVFIANGTSGLQIIDVSDTKNPKIIGSVPNLTYANDIALSSDETTVFIADVDSGVRVINVSEPSFPELITTIPLEGEGKARKILLSEDDRTVFVGNSNSPQDKLQIIDVSDLNNTVQLASLDTPREIFSMVLSPNSEELFIANWELGIQVIDISMLTNPTIINTIETDATFHQVTLSEDGTTLMALDNKTLQIMDINNPLNPLHIGTVDNMFYSQSSLSISSDGTKIIVADYWNGVFIIDLIGL